MRIPLLLAFFLISFSNLFGQVIPDLTRHKTKKKQLKVLAETCDSLAGEGKIQEEKLVALHALRLTSPDDMTNLSLFNFYLGYVNEDEPDSDSTFYFYEKSIEYARKANNPVRVRNALKRVLFMYVNTVGYRKKGEVALKEVLAIIDTTRDESEKAAMYATVGNYYNMIGKYEIQINYLLKGIAIKKKLIENGKITDREAVVVDLMNLGELYLELEQAEKGIGYTLEARKYITITEDYLAHNFKDMADAYIILGQPDKARVYYDSLLITNSKGKLERRHHLRIALDLAFTEYYLSKNKNDSAFIYISKANYKASEYAPEYLLSQVHYMTGKTYMATKDYVKALPLLIASELLCQESGPQVYVSLLQSIAQCYAATGQWKQAYEYYDKYAPLRDSLYLEASKNSIADAEAKYQNKDKQLQIEQKNNQINEAKKERIWLLSGLSLLLLSLVLLWIIYRNKKKNAELLTSKNQELAQAINELEEANRTKAKLFSIISHDLRSPISQVYQFLKLQQLNPNLLNETQKAELSTKIQTATGSLLETMEDLLLWSKTQINEFKTDKQTSSLNLIVDQCIGLLQLNIDAKNIELQKNLPANTTVFTDPYYLQNIVRNLLQNAIKASDQESFLQIDFTEDGSSAILAIENTGPAFSQQDYLDLLNDTSSTNGMNGLGLRLVDDLSKRTGLIIRFENPSPMLTRALIFFQK